MDARRRRQAWWVVAAVAALALIAGCGLFRGGTEEPVAPAPVAAADSVPPSAEEPVAEPEPTTPSPSPSRATAKPKPKKPKPAKPTPTEDPNNFTPPECADYEGKEVSKSTAKAALTAAAAKTYWPTSAPKLKVPARLVLATAWQESGWTSNIVNCDGGFGLMQVMPDTEAFVNQRFEKSYDSRDHRENAVLGANYLAWLTRYFGEKYFDDDYSLSAARCKTHSSRCLLNMVIAGYNAGHGTVDAAYADKRLPNPAYVDSVRSLMKSCYCDRY
jgi:soluble lytic murein transglycosylase-like protein